MGVRYANIENVGFFQCVDHGAGPVCPLTKLDEAIDKWKPEQGKTNPSCGIANSLIVLPEAFNFGRYEEGSEPILEAGALLEKLRKRAETHGVIFVVGVIENRRNSAYIIDARAPRLMCRKVGDDLMGTYDPCTGDPDPCNPIAFSNAHVAALICMDASADPKNAERQPRVKARFNRMARRLKLCNGRKILCVPARSRWEMDLGCFSQMPDCWRVVANGLESKKSFIAHPGGVIEASTANKNELRLFCL